MPNVLTKNSFNLMAGVPALARPAQRPNAGGATQAPNLNAAEIFENRRLQARGEVIEGPIEGENIFARRARQVRAQRAGAAPEVDQAAGIFTPEGAARVFASRKAAR